MLGIAAVAAVFCLSIVLLLALVSGPDHDGADAHPEGD